jgi:hypothetical protein
VDNKEAAGIQDLREVTQKPRIIEPLLQISGILKQTNSKNVPMFAANPNSPLKEEKEEVLE